MKRIVLAFVGLISLPVWAALDAPDQKRLDTIQQDRRRIQYDLPKDQRVAAFEKLATQSTAFVKDRPTAAEAWIWSGIVNSSWASAQGPGLGALEKAKLAKADLEKALSIDPTALQGSAYTSLAVLYDRVPGWPLAFGDSDKAGELLQKALKINPDGIDPLYFWGDHQYRQGKYAEARDALNKALKAPPRPGRELADASRKKDIQTLLVDVNKKLD